MRIAFQRKQASSSFADETEAQTLSNWTTLKAASDATKVVVGPAQSNTVIPQSEFQTSGGNDNSTAKGLPEFFGNGVVTVSGVFKSLAPSVSAELDNLSQFSLPNSVGNTNLTAFLIGANGVIYCNSDYRGIPIYNFGVGTAGSEGLNSKNMTPFQFVLPANWDRDLVSLVPSFDPLTQI